MRRTLDRDMETLVAFIGGPNYGWYHGYYLWQQTGLRAGRLYPALDELMRLGVIEDSWIEGRRAYRGTDLCLAWAGR